MAPLSNARTIMRATSSGMLLGFSVAALSSIRRPGCSVIAALLRPQQVVHIPARSVRHEQADLLARALPSGPTFGSGVLSGAADVMIDQDGQAIDVTKHRKI